MPRKRLTREESKARTRAELLRAASRLFLRKGFTDTSLADIAEEAALTKGAVYSNFESKEDLFLALLQNWTSAGDEMVADKDRLATGAKPDRRNVALFLEMNAVALRSQRAREWVEEHNAAFFRALGETLRDEFGEADADAEVLGLVAQSLHVGLMMHSAFMDTAPGEDVYAAAYRLLAQLARDTAPIAPT